MSEETHGCSNCYNKIRKNGREDCSICVANENDPTCVPSQWTPYPEDSKPSDPVNHPDHYKTKTGLETIDVIEAFTDGLIGIEATDTGNVIKYICRWKKKNGLQDLQKAQWYLNHLINHVEKECN